MKWIDCADETKARNAALPPGITPEPFAEGVAFRIDDGTPKGRWRVCAEDMTAARWIVWDLRRGHPDKPHAVPVATFRTPQAAILYAEVLMRVRPLRVAHSTVRVARETLRAAKFLARQIGDEFTMEGL